MVLNSMTVSAENNAFAYFLFYHVDGEAMPEHVGDVEFFFIMVLVMEI